MQWLAAISVKRPVFASVLILALTVIGAFSFSRLPNDGVSGRPLCSFVIANAWHSLPGPLQSFLLSSVPLRSCMRSMPSTGSTALISTAPTPPTFVVTFTQ